MRYDDKTDFDGVSKYGKYLRARIRIDGEQKHIAFFTRARDASMAYNDDAKSHLPHTKLKLSMESRSRTNSPTIML